MEELLEKARAVSRALRAAHVPHAVIGGLAVRSHVAAVSMAAVMTTRDMDLLLRREDLDKAASALEPLGFTYRKVKSISAFVIPGKNSADAVHIVWAGEKVRPDSLYPSPSIENCPVLAVDGGFDCLDITRLVFMKLTSFRHKDIVHIQALQQLGLIKDETLSALPPDLLARLKQIEEDTKREQAGE